ncbi:hypothetical protein MHK_006612, partial [Candidatus Magnetomorum sp. HK-1]
MKYILSVFLLLVLEANAIGGGYFSGVSVDEYDKDTGLYYKSVKNGIQGGGFFSKERSDNNSDINIYNPNTGHNVLIFNDKKPRKITEFIYESQYQKKTNSMSFGSNESLKYSDIGILSIIPISRLFRFYHSLLFVS